MIVECEHPDCTVKFKPNHPGSPRQQRFCSKRCSGGRIGRDKGNSKAARVKSGGARKRRFMECKPCSECGCKMWTELASRRYCCRQCYFSARFSKTKTDVWTTECPECGSTMSADRKVCSIECRGRHVGRKNKGRKLSKQTKRRISEKMMRGREKLMPQTPCPCGCPGTEDHCYNEHRPPQKMERLWDDQPPRGAELTF